MDNLEYHPLADLFPLIEGVEFDALVGDIRANGLHEAIDLFQGKILDGRNRYRAAMAAGIELEKRNFRHFHTEIYGDPLAYVLSKNLTRRHLDESQRAMVGARLATMRQGERTDLAAEPSANLPKVDQSSAAKALSISERALRHARRVQDHGEPELVRAVDRGHLAVSVAEKAARMAPELQRRIAAEAEAGNASAARGAVKKEARAVREVELATAQRELPKEKFGVILADPEWRFQPYSRDSGMDRAADNHYSTSATEVIAARPVGDIAADDCVLFLWATVPMLPDALAVMAAWGFTYKSHCVWTKTYASGKPFLGTGYWFRNAHELLLVGTRGNIPAPAMGDQEPSALESPVGAHSAKPELFLEMIEGYFPNLPKIELNRRGPARKGWSAWGNEAEPADSSGTPLDDDSKTGEIEDVDAAAGDGDRCRTHAGVSGVSRVDDVQRLSERRDILAAEDDGLDIPIFLRRKRESEVVPLPEEVPFG